MAREIKFRQPLFHNGKKFSEFHYWGYDTNGIFTSPTGNLNELEKNTGSNEFTGLSDKNDVDIFEGDFIKLHEYGDDVYKEVVFYKGKFCVHGFNWDVRTCEVIGNVYQNPDLL